MGTNVEWLMENAGPILRYRTARELIGKLEAGKIDELYREAVECPDARRWLSALEASTHLHSSDDTAAENSIAKLRAYGLCADHLEVEKLLDDVYRRLYAEERDRDVWDAAILFPFLVAVGYFPSPEIMEYAVRRLSVVCDYARTSLAEFANDDDVESLFLSHREKEQLGVPDRWRDKHVWQPSIEQRIPTCYDFYLFSHLEGYDEERELILQFVGTRRFQRLCERRELEGTYGWDPGKRYCWSVTQMPYLFGFFGFGQPHFSPNKFLLYLELVSRFPDADRMPWFRAGLNHLDQFRLDSGRYRFPSTYVPERRGGYYLYAGAHMRLGERGKLGLEIESTFRMLSMARNADVLL